MASTDAPPDNVQISRGMMVGGGKKASDYAGPAPAAGTTFPHGEDGLLRLVERIRERGLERNVMELELLGYTVVEPEKVAPIGLSDRALAKVTEIAESRVPLTCDLEKGFVATSAELGADASDKSPFGMTLTHVLFQDPAFQEILLNETLELLTSVCVGTNNILYTYSAFIKGAGSPMLPLHCDHHMPPPHPPADYRCSTIWLLTDFSGDNGATLLVPGSHRHARQPMPGEGLDKAVPLEAPRGSLLVFKGSTWHGALARTSPGLRVSLHIQFARHFMHTSEGFRGTAPQEVLDANPERFRWLIGDLLHYEYGPEGAANPSQMGRNIAAGELIY
jgi:hypothetical protein